MAGTCNSSDIVLDVAFLYLGVQYCWCLKLFSSKTLSLDCDKDDISSHMIRSTAYYNLPAMHRKTCELAPAIALPCTEAERARTGITTQMTNPMISPYLCRSLDPCLSVTAYLSHDYIISTSHTSIASLQGARSGTGKTHKMPSARSENRYRFRHPGFPTRKSFRYKR
jgi:hypothetical protein